MATYEVTEGRGLPIGNITSQYFANLYLDGLDRMFRPYVRYMDDFVIWSNDKESLKCIKDKVVLYAKEKLSLTLKDFPFINRTSLGMDFFGMRIFPDKIHLSRRSCTRYLKKLRELEWAYHIITGLSVIWNANTEKRLLPLLLSGRILTIGGERS